MDYFSNVEQHDKKNKLLPEPILKLVSYSLVNPDGLIIFTGSYRLCIQLKKQHKFATVKANWS